MGLLMDNNEWIRNGMTSAHLSDKLFPDYRLITTHFAIAQWRVVQVKYFPNQYFPSTSSILKNILGCGFENGY